MTSSSAAKTVVMISTPLEQEYADRIAAVAPDRVEVIYRPDLMPPTRYQGDHNGPSEWHRTPEADAEYRALLARAEVLWDFGLQVGGNPFDLSPRLKWVQTTSAGVGQHVKRLGVAESDLIVTTSSGVHAEPLTEFVFAVLLYHEKNFAAIQQWQSQK